MDFSTPGFPALHHLLELANVHWFGDAIQTCCILLSPSPPGFDLSQQSFFNELALHIRWSKYWSFSLGIRSLSPSNEYSGLILFKTDWFDPLAIQGTLKSFFQHHSSKASIHWHSAFIMVQLSHLYMTTAKAIALTRWTFVGKVTSLPFNALSRFVIVFLPRAKSPLNWDFSKYLPCCCCWWYF